MNPKTTCASCAAGFNTTRLKTGKENLFEIRISFAADNVILHTSKPPVPYIFRLSPEVIAPISGTISFIGEQKHTYGITGFDGIEVLIHLGIGTVSLNGEGFTPLVKTGQRVNAGDRICIVNWEEIKNKGFDITSPEVITSTAIDKIKRLTLTTGFATAGISACMRYVIK